MGHKLTLDQSAFKEIARIAAERKTGARGLNNIFSDLLFSTMYTLSGTVEPTECLLRGSDIKQHRPPVLRRIRKLGAEKERTVQGAGKRLLPIWKNFGGKRRKTYRYINML